MNAPLRISWYLPALAVSWVLAAPLQLACQVGAARPAQAPRAQTATAGDTLSAALLKRVAAAVDGYRIGELVWVVVSFTAPYRVDTVVASLEVANRRRTALAGDYHVVGPYRAGTDYNAGQQPLFLPYCHELDTDPCNMEYALAAPPWEYQAIDSIVVAVHRGGEAWRRRFPPGSVDALFFTLAAAEKFYFPYLAQVYGQAFADSVWNATRFRRAR